MTYTYTYDEVIEKYEEAERLDLSGYELLEDSAIAVKECNGIGANWMPTWMRVTISTLCPSIVLAADIHDLRYYNGGTEADRLRADTEFLTNVELIALDYNILRRWIVRSTGQKMYELLRSFGRWAWNYKHPHTEEYGGAK